MLKVPRGSVMDVVLQKVRETMPLDPSKPIRSNITIFEDHRTHFVEGFNKLRPGLSKIFQPEALEDIVAMNTSPCEDDVLDFKANTFGAVWFWFVASALSCDPKVMILNENVIHFEADDTHDEHEIYHGNLSGLFLTNDDPVSKEHAKLSKKIFDEVKGVPETSKKTTIKKTTDKKTAGKKSAKK